MPISRSIAIAAAVTTLAATAAVGTQVLGSSDDASAGLDRFELKASDLPGYTQAARVKSAEGCSRRAFTRVTLRRLRARRVTGCATATWRREANGDVAYLLAYLFEDASSASAALPLFRKDYLANATNSDGVDVVSRHSLAVSALGDEAPRGVRLATDVGSQRATAFAYWWRRDKVVAVLVVADTLRGHDQRAALALAHRIDERAAN